MDNKKPSPEIQKKRLAKTQDKSKPSEQKTREKEYGGYEDEGLPEPTRYNDWEVKGRCSDF